jgi:hypothetical protein
VAGSIDFLGEYTAEEMRLPNYIPPSPRPCELPVESVLAVRSPLKCDNCRTLRIAIDPDNRELGARAGGLS